MEQWKVVGYRAVDFKDQSGRQVHGYSLFLAREPENENIVGLEVSKVFVSDNVTYEPKENELVNILYNRYGKVAAVTPVGS